MNTSWTEYLHRHGAQIDASGAVAFHTPQEESALAASTTILTPLTHLGMIQVSGDDACTYLHNLTSNDVKKLGSSQAHLNSLSGPKGRMLANFVVWRINSEYCLMLSGDLQADILKKLKMYVLRSKVQLTNVSDEHILLGLAGPNAIALLRAYGINDMPEILGIVQLADLRILRLDKQRFVLDCPAAMAESIWIKLLDAGARPAGTIAWQWLDITAGLPVISAAIQDEFVAQMVNFELLGGVSFQKGCFPGQEIIARTQHLGKIKKRMYCAHIEETSDISPGMDLYAPEFGTQSCGKVVMAAAAPQSGTDLLAVIQMSAHDTGPVWLSQPEGTTLHFTELPYQID
jgi:tRNA-modifying protein YgfZ